MKPRSALDPLTRIERDVLRLVAITHAQLKRMMSYFFGGAFGQAK
jgi:hypothetical protein